MSRLMNRQLAGHGQMEAPLPPSPQLLALLREKQESVLLSGDGAGHVGAPLRPAPWLHTPGAGRAGSRLLGGLGRLPVAACAPHACPVISHGAAHAAKATS